MTAGLDGTIRALDQRMAAGGGLTDNLGQVAAEGGPIPTGKCHHAL